LPVVLQNHQTPATTTLTALNDQATIGVLGVLAALDHSLLPYLSTSCVDRSRCVSLVVQHGLGGFFRVSTRR
jgi:hypothetical protein